MSSENIKILYSLREHVTVQNIRTLARQGVIKNRLQNSIVKLNKSETIKTEQLLSLFIYEVYVWVYNSV